MFEEVVSEEVVRHFCDVATRRLGIGIDAKVEALVAGRVAKRMQLLRLPVDEYVQRLDRDKECSEVIEFLDLVRPRPLRFFARQRDYDELEALVVRRLRCGQRRFRLWSAGCGTGEEAYGMLLTAFAAMERAQVERDAVDLKILATDISARSIELGRRGWFDEAQICGVPALLRDRYFVEAEDGVAVDDSARTLVVFRRLNLAHPPFPMTGPLDAIFCHEGLAPLVPGARQRAMHAAKALLASRGVMCTGLDEEALVAIEDEEEILWQGGLRGVVRSPVRPLKPGQARCADAIGTDLMRSLMRSGRALRRLKYRFERTMVHVRVAVGAFLELVEDLLEDLLAIPARELVVNGVPGTESLRQVSPRNARLGDVEDRVHEGPVGQVRWPSTPTCLGW
jgi:chemotaxis protein methyltransferase CheR